MANDPLERLRRIDAYRERLALMHARVGLAFFMPATRDRLRARLYRKWREAGQAREMLVASIYASPELRERYQLARGQSRRGRSM